MGHSASVNAEPTQVTLTKVNDLKLYSEYDLGEVYHKRILELVR